MYCSMAVCPSSWPESIGSGRVEVWVKFRVHIKVYSLGCVGCSPQGSGFRAQALGPGFIGVSICCSG